MKRFIYMLIVGLLTCSLTSSAWAITQWAKGKPAASDHKSDWPTDEQANNSVLDTLLSNYRAGLALSYNSGSTINVSAGEVVVSNAAGTVRLFLKASGSGTLTFSNLDTGAEGSSTTYYVYAGTSTATDSAPTFYVSLSSSAPSGVTYYKRIGTFYNDSASNVSLITNTDGGSNSAFLEPSASSEGTSYSSGVDYTNTTGRKLLIVAYGHSVNTGGFWAIDLQGAIGATSPSSTVADFSASLPANSSVSQKGQVVFMVPVGWHWSVTNSSVSGIGAGAIDRIEAWQTN